MDTVIFIVLIAFLTVMGGMGLYGYIWHTRHEDFQDGYDKGFEDGYKAAGKENRK